ncbi:MAG TPA: hypothetical protein VKR28_07730, partial [Candidatus Binatus sp.]|nr:hypothetical protein [Candidatus Binatus sp.]
MTSAMLAVMVSAPVGSDGVSSMDSTVSETGKTVPVWAAYKPDANVFDEMMDHSSEPRSGC